jgi:hypothetical protein
MLTFLVPHLSIWIFKFFLLKLFISRGILKKVLKRDEKKTKTVSFPSYHLRIMAPPFQIVSMHIKTLAAATNFKRTFEINIFETMDNLSSLSLRFYHPM